jgi:hypothetical protein
MRQEHRHHTDEQIRDAIAFALDVVTEAELTDDLAVQAFSAAVQLRCAKSITEVQPAPLAMPAMAIPGQR